MIIFRVQPLAVEKLNEFDEMFCKNIHESFSVTSTTIVI